MRPTVWKTVAKAFLFCGVHSNLDAKLVPNSDQILLSWRDDNSVGENRYRVERSVNGSEFEETLVRPRSDTTIQHQVKPDWLGQKIQYQVFERLWGQKLFSSPAAVVMPDSLEPPANLRYDVSYEEGAGNVVTILWDHAPLFRNYIVELHSEDGWTRMDKIAENHTTAYAQPGEHKFRVYSHINGAMSTPAEIAVSVPPG